MAENDAAAIPTPPNGMNPPTLPPSDSAALTQMEQVTAMTKAGLTSTDIAKALGVSERTVYRLRKRAQELRHEASGHPAPSQRSAPQPASPPLTPQPDTDMANSTVVLDSHTPTPLDSVQVHQAPDRHFVPVRDERPTCAYCKAPGRVGYNDGDLLPAEIRGRPYLAHAKCFDRLVARLRGAAA
jgi:DNA-binding CsgD family transcriptional regulator